MKFFSLSIASILAISLFFSACQEELGLVSAETHSVETDIANGVHTVAVGFSESEIQEIGKIHNEYLLESYSALDADSKVSKEEQIANYFKNLDVDISSTGYTMESLYEFSVQSYNKLSNNEFLLSNKNTSTVLDEYLRQIYSELNSALSLDDFISSTQDLYDDVSFSTNISNAEIEAVKVTIVVAQNSASLWMPESMGGEGLTSTPNSATKWNWGGAVAGDIGGAMSVMAELGLAGAILGSVPGTNGAIALAVGVSAAIGSALGGICC